MKTFAAVAIIAAASTVNAWDAEFMRGAQTGFFLTSEEQFEDYSCPVAEINPMAKTYIDMAMPMKMMFTNMNKGEPSPMIDLAFDSVLTFAKIAAVFDENYDGGEFCKGLFFSKEASKVVFAMGNQLMGRVNHTDSQPESL